MTAAGKGMGEYVVVLPDPVESGFDRDRCLAHAGAMRSGAPTVRVLDRTLKLTECGH